MNDLRSLRNLKVSSADGPTGHSARDLRNLKVGGGVPAQKSGGGGLLGTIGRAVKQGAKDLEQAAISSPAGAAVLGKAVVHDVKAQFVEPVTGRKQGSELLPIGRAVGQSLVMTAEHPLRHPGDTLLAGLGAASLLGGTAARVGAASRAVRAGEGAAGAGRALTTAPRVPRVLHYTSPEGKTAEVVAGSYSRAAVPRQVQKGLDRIREAHPNARLGLLTQTARVGRANRRNVEILDKLAQIPAAKLAATSKKLSTVQHTALRVVAEGAPIDERVATLTSVLPKAKGLVARGIRQELALLDAARPLVQDVPNEHGILVPRLVDPKLQAHLGRIGAVAEARTQAALRAGLLSPQAAASRTAAPGRVFKGARFDTKQSRLVGAEGFSTDVVPDLIRIPYSNRPLLRGGFTKGLGSGRVVGVQRKPGTLTHQFTGSLALAGGGEKNVGKLVAQDYLQLAKFLRAETTRNYFRRIAQASPDGLREPVAVRLKPNVKIRPDTQRLLQRQEQGLQLTNAEQASLRSALQAQFEDVFPKDVPHEPQAGIGFVERKLLGGLDNPSPLVGVNPHSGTGRALGVVDDVNNASKLAFVTLKASYAVPNAFGNLALHITQAGWAAPRNIGRAVLLTRKFGPETSAAVDALMGEGLTSVLRSEQGIGSRAATTAANFWGKGVDVPFRRASFLHEASVRGFKTQAQVEDLLSNPAHLNKLLEITLEANRDLIDYANLGNIEKTVIRRVLFLYPWTKGSTVFAGRFLRDHPIQAAAVAQLGQLGAKSQEQLGPLPSFARQLIPAGPGRTVNPTSATILGTPGELLSQLEGAPGSNVADLLSPLAQVVNSTIQGRDELGRPIRGNLGAKLAKSVGSQVRGVPLLTTSKQLRGQRTSKSFPLTRQQALLAALLSRSFVPVNTNVPQLNTIAMRQRSGR